jgi:hypothetical protein
MSTAAGSATTVASAVQHEIVASEGMTLGAMDLGSIRGC